MLSASHFISRGRSKSRHGSNNKKRSSSHDDCAAPATNAGNLFSFLSATVKSKYNRFDDFDGDVDEDEIDEEDIDDEVGAVFGSPEEEAQNEDKDGKMDDNDRPTPSQRLDSSGSIPKVDKLFQKLDIDDNKKDLNASQESLGGQSMLAASVHEMVGDHSRSRAHSVGTIDSLKTHDLKVQDERASALIEKLRKKLGLTDDSVVYGEYPCWLLKSILLQGHLYLTDKHVCFFAYLPRRKREMVIKSGSLGKKAKRTPKYTRYWFQLRTDSLSYYVSSTELYFPSGTIDLRYAIKAETTKDNDNNDTQSFTILTEQRTYHFHADSPVSAKDWVKRIQREIFRSRNDGDSVKIVIPVQNIIDLEERSVFEISETLKIRAIDNEDTYAIDEYVLAFFKLGQEARIAIKSIMKRLGVPLGESQETHKPKRSVSEHVIDTTTSMIDSKERAKTEGSQPTRGNRFRSLSTLSALSHLNPVGRSRSQSSRSRSPTASVRSLTNLLRLQDPDDKNKTPPSEKQDTPNATTSDEDKDRYDILTPGETQESINVIGKAGSQASKPKRYSFSVVNKMTEMWEGGMKHFRAAEDDNTTKKSDEDPHLVNLESEQESNSRFRSHFSLTEDSLVATYYAHIQKAFPIYGKLYLSDKHLCFRSLLPGTRTKMVLPISDIENVTKEKGFRFGYSGLVVVIHGHEEVFFEFSSANPRDDCEVMVLRQMDIVKYKMEQSTESMSGSLYLDHARLSTYEDALGREIPNGDLPPALVDERQAKVLAQQPYFKKHFTMLTIGSRGDVQPYIALCKGLMKEGHTTRIATHEEFKDWIESFGIEFRPVAGDPGELMQIMVEHGMFSVSFIREASARFRSWIDELLHTAWEACQGTDVLIESPSAMAGLHIAEALRIPYFRAFTMPWTRTRAYPHAFIVPEQKMGGSYNYLTYVLFDNVFWKGIQSQVNAWRKNELKLPRTNLDMMQQTKVPFLYSVSPSIFVPPVDFSDWVRVTGYWFLDDSEGDKFDPPHDLTKFIKKARRDGKKLVYIGFGSIVVSNPKELTKAVVKSVEKAGVRCILSKGWSDRLDKKNATTVEVELPKCIHQVSSVPHDWLFPQIDAAVHHGGSGTTGASMRAGLPTIIKPFFGDQFFYAGRIEDLGAGVHLKKLTVSSFSKALWEVTHNDRIITKAAAIGRHIRQENGVATAIVAIYENMEYATNLTLSRIPQAQSGGIIANAAVSDADESDGSDDDGDNNDDEDDEHENTDGSWTIVHNAKSKLSRLGL